MSPPIEAPQVNLLPRLFSECSAVPVAMGATMALPSGTRNQRSRPRNCVAPVAPTGPVTGRAGVSKYPGVGECDVAEHSRWKEGFT